MRDRSSILCGSILFHNGLHHKPSGSHAPNAVARFGDDSKETVFATLHDLSKVFDCVESLENQKPEQKRGKPFVFFTNSDISDITKRHGGDPPRQYLDCVYNETPPVHCQRTRSFDFREFCETMREKEDPAMEKIGAEWNEIRAVLDWDNMVGLCYIHDPMFDPRQHVAMAKQLSENFNNVFEMAVFRVHEPGGVTGDLLVRDGEDGEYQPAADISPPGPANGNAKHACEYPNRRLVTLHEYLQDIKTELKQ
eukprot:jgi/Chrzof1/13838/Cz08g14130.t1